MKSILISEIFIKIVPHITNIDIMLLRRVSKPYKTFIDNNRDIINYAIQVNFNEGTYRVENYQPESIVNLPFNVFFYLDYTDRYNVIEVCKKYIEIGINKLIWFDNHFITISDGVYMYPPLNSNLPTIIFKNNTYSFSNNDYLYECIHENDMNRDIFNKKDGLLYIAY